MVAGPAAVLLLHHHRTRRAAWRGSGSVRAAGLIVDVETQPPSHSTAAAQTLQWMKLQAPVLQAPLAWNGKRPRVSRVKEAAVKRAAPLSSGRQLEAAAVERR